MYASPTVSEVAGLTGRSRSTILKEPSRQPRRRSVLRERPRRRTLAWEVDSGDLLDWWCGRDRGPSFRVAEMQAERARLRSALTDTEKLIQRVSRLAKDAQRVLANGDRAIGTVTRNG
jgi:hypothetical protein